MVINTLILLATSASGAILTSFVSERLKQGPVRSSSGLSLLVACLCYFAPHAIDPFLIKNIPAVFIGSSFIGMVSWTLVPSYLRIGFAGIIFCIIYLNASRFFNGYGGALGTTASISVLAVISLPVLNIKQRSTNSLQQLKKMISRKSK